MNRFTPQLPAHNMQTYQVASPLTSHWRPATCAEVDCEQHRNGWVTAVDESTDLGQRQAHHIRTNCRPVDKLAARGTVRRYSETRTPEGWTAFRFPAGQECFAEHKVPLERPELYIVRDGDWRGNPRGTQPRRHARPEDWVEDFSEHHDRLATLRNRG